MKTNKKVYFISTGLVLGLLWGGGEGVYSAITLKANTKKKLLAMAEKGLDGSLDSGMGFERLLGALINIKRHTILTINRAKYENVKYEDPVIIGKLTDKQIYFLVDVQNNQ